MVRRLLQLWDQMRVVKRNPCILTWKDTCKRKLCLLEFCVYNLILCVYSHFGCIPPLCVYYSHFVSTLPFCVYTLIFCVLSLSVYTPIFWAYSHFVCKLPFSVYTLYTKVALSHGDANYSSKIRLYTQEQCDSVHKNFVCTPILCVYSHFVFILSFCVYTPFVCILYTQK